MKTESLHTDGQGMSRENVRLDLLRNRVRWPLFTDVGSVVMDGVFDPSLLCTRHGVCDVQD